MSATRASRPLSVLLVRHGQSAANAGGRAARHADVPLTDLGHSQARAVAERIEVRPQLVVSSPFLRARQTAEPLLARYADARSEIWPIEEYSYLSHEHGDDTTLAMRKPLVDLYWKRCDPFYVDGPGAESFAGFVERLRAFHGRLGALPFEGPVVAFGHGQFFRAFLLCLERGFDATPEAMRNFRANEVAHPIANTEILPVTIERS